MKLIPQLNQRGCLGIHGGFSPKRGYLHYGNKSREVRLLNVHELSGNEILISMDLIHALAIPLFCEFDLLVWDNDMILGPHIGILAVKKESELVDSLENYHSYVYDYSAIGGSIVIFSQEGVNPITGFVSGYVYHPIRERFEKQTIPFPAALFKRIPCNTYWRAYFNHTTGQRVFNDRLVGKWKMYGLLAASHRLRDYLPETILYGKPGDIHRMLRLYPELYIKHVYGSQGKGIHFLKKRGKWVLAVSAGNNGKQLLKNRQELDEYLHTHITKKEYIAQRAIPILTDRGRNIDFRLITVKGGTGCWKVKAVIARYGTDHSIVSNVSAGGSAKMAYEAIKAVLRLEEEHIYLLVQQMKEIALEIGRCLDAAGYFCGNLGIDLALDDKARIWILEVNNRDPNHTIAMDAKEKSLFYDTRLDNMLYAKCLCGFGKDQEECLD